MFIFNDQEGTNIASLQEKLAFVETIWGVGEGNKGFLCFWTNAGVRSFIQLLTQIFQLQKFLEIRRKYLYIWAGKLFIDFFLYVAFIDILLHWKMIL